MWGDLNVGPPHLGCVSRNGAGGSRNRRSVPPGGDRFRPVAGAEFDRHDGPVPSPAPGPHRESGRAAAGEATTRGESAGEPARPAWQRRTPGEPRWPASLALLLAVGLQTALPERLNLSSRYLLPAVEVVLLVALVAVNPGRVDRLQKPLRLLSLTLIVVASVGNAYSVVTLVVGLVTGTAGSSPGPLLATGSAIYVTNVLVFALWYWELDRGGPAARAHGLDPYPDFLFPQLTSPTMASPDWEPAFGDYLYLSFTNSTAFSPTDTLPLTRGAKTAMALQSAVSLVTVALVIARSVNILR